MYWYRITQWSSQSVVRGKVVKKLEYKAEYKRSYGGRWNIYYGSGRDTWQGAYGILQRHASPYALQARFVGTF